MPSRQFRRRRSHGPSRPSPAVRGRGTELRIPQEIPEDSELLQVMKWLLANTCSFLREAGYSRTQLSRELLQLERDASPAPSVQRLMARRDQTLSAVERLVRQWRADLPYVHPETGSPRSLHLEEGEACLGMLLAEHFPRLSVPDALACLEEHGAIVRQADGSYFPLQRYAPHVLLEVVAMRSCRYLQTGLRNLRAREVAQSYPDQSTVTSRLPPRLLAEFVALSKMQLNFMIGTVDLWLMDRHVEDPAEPCVQVSLHGYASVEFEAPPAEGRRRPKLRAKRRNTRGTSKS